MDEQQALGEPHQLQWGKRLLKLSLITQDVKKAINAACKATAIAEFQELRLMSPETADADWQSMRDSMLAGNYSWTGPNCSEWLKTATGQRVLIETLLRHGGTPLSSGDVVKLMRDESMSRLLVDVVELIIMESAAPK